MAEREVCKAQQSCVQALVAGSTSKIRYRTLYRSGQIAAPDYPIGTLVDKNNVPIKALDGTLMPISQVGCQPALFCMCAWVDIAQETAYAYDISYDGAPLGLGGPKLYVTWTN